MCDCIKDLSDRIMDEYPKYKGKKTVEVTFKDKAIIFGENQMMIDLFSIFDLKVRGVKRMYPITMLWSHCAFCGMPLTKKESDSSAGHEDGAMNKWMDTKSAFGKNAAEIHIGFFKMTVYEDFRRKKLCVSTHPLIISEDLGDSSLMSRRYAKNKALRRVREVLGITTQKIDEVERGENG